MIAQAQSGTGKTATFLMAMLSRTNANEPYCQCLCIVPTLELAIQLADVGRRMAKYIKGITFGTGTRDPQGLPLCIFNSFQISIEFIISQLCEQPFSVILIGLL
ncbi:hypothetical protein EG68_07508 [Paragonimus skrjabini miyazakii]|uniref:DEAD/DEAH-box helicase domain-containing protein n=1 Tax=Paragonimus skrjabini miyazakii TaxID=59628 RepID=A0A8S9YQ33_9TREM|nr:hypothetical protein EG68_07508 [Paragonimus skrjabini miyazakii]